MSKVNMYNGQAGNIADKIESKVSDLMQTVKKHPSMKKYSPHVRKGVQKEIKAILNNRISTFSLKIDVDDINKWLDEYTPYAQASTTAYIQRVAKEMGYKTLTKEQVDYVKDALLNSMEPNESFDWETGEGVKIPLHGRALGTERNLAAKVATHVEWAEKKTVGNALKPENVIEFLVKNKKSLGIDNIDDIDMKYVDNVISVASMSLYGERSSNGKKITERSIQNIDNALLHAAFTANTNMSDFSGALLRKIGTSTFVNNDTRLGEIKKEFDNRIGAKARLSQNDAQNYARLRALMDRFFTALRWSMHYKTGKMGTSTYTAENQYMKIELAILEFVANTTLPLAELVRRFEQIFASNDNPEAVERLYMTEVLNAWWVNVSKVLGIDDDIALEIQSDIIAEKSGEYVEGNAGHFERDIDREKAIQAGFKTIRNAVYNGVDLLATVRENMHDTDKLVKKYIQAKKEAELQKKGAAEAKRKKMAELKKNRGEAAVERAKQIDARKRAKSKAEAQINEEEKKRIAKERAKERYDTKKRAQDKLIDNFKAAYMQNAKEISLDDSVIKALDRTTLNNLKYTLFGTHKKLTESDLPKFLSVAYRLSGADTKGKRDLFIATHAGLINDILDNKDVLVMLKQKRDKAKEKRDATKALHDKLIDDFGATNVQNAKEISSIDRKIKVLDKTTLNKLKNTLFGASKELTKSDLPKFLSAAYRVSGANDKGTRDLFIATHAGLINNIFNNEDVSSQLEEVVEAEKINTSMTNFIRSSASDFDADFNKLRSSSNRYLQQTTSRLKTDVVRKISDSKLTRDLRTYRAAKNERHKAIVNSSVSDFITKANKSLDKWAQEAEAEAVKLYSGREKEKTKALGQIAKLKKARQVKINSEAREMKNEALKKFHDAIYS